MRTQSFKRNFCAASETFGQIFGLFGHFLPFFRGFFVEKWVKNIGKWGGNIEKWVKNIGK
jgi:hypothetical protein